MVEDEVDEEEVGSDVVGVALPTTLTMPPPTLPLLT